MVNFEPLNCHTLITRKELLELYNCSYQTLRKWLREAGLQHDGRGNRRMLTPHEFDLLKALIGEPRK